MGGSRYTCKTKSKYIWNYYSQFSNTSWNIIHSYQSNHNSRLFFAIRTTSFHKYTFETKSKTRVIEGHRTHRGGGRCSAKSWTTRSRFQDVRVSQSRWCCSRLPNVRGDARAPPLLPPSSASSRSQRCSNVAPSATSSRGSTSTRRSRTSCIVAASLLFGPLASPPPCSS